MEKNHAHNQFMIGLMDGSHLGQFVDIFKKS
jgi:hypothetical protein